MISYYPRIGLFALLAVSLSSSFAGVFYSKTEALELAFGKNTVEQLSLFPDEQELAQIQKLAKVKVDSSLFTFYVGKESNRILGYAAIETNTVRTKPETLLIVLSPEGQVQKVVSLAFHEPPEYMPPTGWYEKLTQKPLDEIALGKGVDGISGATLSSQSAVNSVRKVLAFHQIMIKKSGVP